jgi:hypothetical protein
MMHPRPLAGGFVFSDHSFVDQLGKHPAFAGLDDADHRLIDRRCGRLAESGDRAIDGGKCA